MFSVVRSLTIGGLQQGPPFLDTLVNMKMASIASLIPLHHYTCTYHYVKDSFPFSMYIDLTINYAKK